MNVIHFLKFRISPAAKVFNSTWQIFKSNPAVLVPFLIFGVFEIITLVILYLAPRMPLKLLFGPIIRTFWGEIFLHYPANFILLPKLFHLARMGLLVLIGSLITGMAVRIVLDVHNRKHLNLKEAMKSSLRQYVSFFAITLIMVICFYAINKFFGWGLNKYFSGHTSFFFIGARTWLGPIAITVNFIIAVLIQSLFIYAIPILVIENERLKISLIKSFLTFKKLFLTTILLVGIPALIYIPIVILDYNTSLLVHKLFPELILWVLVSGMVINSLIIDPVVTVSITSLYLTHRKEK